VSPAVAAARPSSKEATVGKGKADKKDQDKDKKKKKAKK